MVVVMFWTCYVGALHVSWIVHNCPRLMIKSDLSCGRAAFIVDKYGPRLIIKSEDRLVVALHVSWIVRSLPTFDSQVNTHFVVDRSHAGVRTVARIVFVVQICPYCKISGGVSNLSFGFRGVNVIREVRIEAPRPMCGSRLKPEVLETFRAKWSRGCTISLGVYIQACFCL